MAVDQRVNNDTMKSQKLQTWGEKLGESTRSQRVGADEEKHMQCLPCCLGVLKGKSRVNREHAREVHCGVHAHSPAGYTMVCEHAHSPAGQPSRVHCGV